MAFIKAFAGALGGTFADEWKDFLAPPSFISATAAVFPAVKVERNAGRGSNTRSSHAIITNGSRILVPEGTALVCVQDGAYTALITQPGGYVWNTDDPASSTFFAERDDGLAATLASSWERFKFGGIPATQQTAFYINMKEIPNNRFGTQATVYWDDAYLGAKAGATARGSYTLKIVDPLLFLRNFVPQRYQLPDAEPFDFSDIDNDATDQLFHEVIATLGQALACYSAAHSTGSIDDIQRDQVGFAKSLREAVEENYRWQGDRGLSIVRVAVTAIEYDKRTRKLFDDVQAADALAGRRGDSFMQQEVARGMRAAGERGGDGSNMAFMGMAMNAMGGSLGALRQTAGTTPAPADAAAASPAGAAPIAGAAPTAGASPGIGATPGADAAPAAETAPAAGAASSTGSAPSASAAADPFEQLSQFKRMLDAGLITQEDYDQAKARVLGL